MIKYKIIITYTFKEELKSILEYISFSLKEPNIADKLYKKIISAIFNLNYFPQRYYKLSDYKNLNIHRVIIKNYVIIYEVDEGKRTS